MPHITLQITQKGALLNAVIGISVARKEALDQASQPIPPPTQIQAIVDTGSNATAVDPSVLEKLNLTPTGSTTIITPSTGNQPVPVDQYDISILIPAARSDQLPLFLPTLPAICVKLLDSQGFHALIGRDILAQCIFSYNGSIGLFTLAY